MFKDTLVWIEASKTHQSKGGKIEVVEVKSTVGILFDPKFKIAVYMY